MKKTVADKGRLTTLDSARLDQLATLLKTATNKKAAGEMCKGYDKVTEAQAKIQKVMTPECLDNIKDKAKGIKLKGLILRRKHYCGKWQKVLLVCC